MPLMKQDCRTEVIDSEVASFAKMIDVQDPLEELSCDDGESLSMEALLLKKELDGARAYKEEEVVWGSIFGVEEVDSAMQNCIIPPPKVSLKPLPLVLNMHF